LLSGAFQEILAWTRSVRGGDVLLAVQSLFCALWMLAIAAFMAIAPTTTAAAPALSPFTLRLRKFTRLALLNCCKTLDRGRILLPRFLPRRAGLLLARRMLLALALFLPAAIFLTAAFLARTPGLLIATAVVAFRPAIAPGLLRPTVAPMLIATSFGPASTAPSSAVIALLLSVGAAGLLVARTRLGGLWLHFWFAR
jgi:hypothetical protein